MRVRDVARTASFFMVMACADDLATAVKEEDFPTHEMIAAEGDLADLDEDYLFDGQKEVVAFNDDDIGQSFDVQGSEAWPNLPYGLRPYVNAGQGYFLGYPGEWLHEELLDGALSKFFAYEEMTPEELEVFDQPVAFFYVKAGPEPGVELDQGWFLSNFYGGIDLIDQPQEEIGAISIVNETITNISGNLYYYVYYYTFTSRPQISFFHLASGKLYELTFFSTKILPAMGEDELFLKFAQVIVSTFSASSDEISGALVGEVPAFAQTDPKWGCEQLGFCWVSGCTGNTIAAQGCLVTSAAMVFNYFSPGYTDPSKLNKCLKEKGGFSEGCLYIWDNQCQPLDFQIVEVYSTQVLATKLNNYPVIIWDTCKYGTHFFVALKKSGNDFEIIDSMDGKKKLLYGSGFCFTRGFVYQADSAGGASVFSCQAGAQNPPTPSAYTMSLGEEKIFELDFKNTGNLVWQSDPASPNYIELWSADKNGANVDSFLQHSSWISAKKVTSLPDGGIDPNVVQKQVLPNQTARFIFRVKVPDSVDPSKMNVDLPIYFIPALDGKTETASCWDGAHFLIKVKGECEAGQKNTQPCGKCGSKSQDCTNGKWGAWSSCSGEGECYPAETQTQDCGSCSYKTRICDSSCFWEAWSACSPGGVCSPGQVASQSCGSDVGVCQAGSQTRSCNTSCQWDPWSACLGEIGPGIEICDEQDNDCNGKDDDPCFKPVYRFYYSSGNDKDHFLKNDSSTPSGYTIENNGNPVFSTYKEQISGTNPLYRLYKASIKDHMYTDSQTEKESALGDGYEAEGNIGYCATNQKPGTVPLHRCWSSKYSDHHSTTNKSECDVEGYSYEQITCYVWP